MAARLAHYGIQVSGNVAPLDSLTHLDEQGLETARLLRDLLAHKRARSPEAKVWKAFDGAVYDLLQEQGFTALNRLCALRMAEERKLITQCVGRGQQSEGFELFEYHTGKTNEGCPVEVRYQQFLYAFFDELALDLGALFARHSPQGLLFPSPQALQTLLGELNHPDLSALWAQDETIGWIYQYWNSKEERKTMRDASAAPRNSRELAVRNQFFTPRYVVEFLTDNTLGRIWYEMTQGDTTLKEQCRYLVRRPTEIFLQPGEFAAEQPKQDNLSQEDLLKQPVHIPHRPLKDPRTILMLDPACGSMHFGLYAFDLFEVIYQEAWELEQKLGADALSRPPGMKSLHATYAGKDAFLKDVPRLIIEHNLHGIDIDPRCAQIAGLSLWLRAQKAWQRLGLKPAERPAIKRSNIVCAEPMPGEKELLREFVEREFPAAERAVCLRLLEAIFDKMQLAGEAGSLLKIEEEIRSAIEDARDAWQKLATKPQELFTTTELNQISTAPELTGLEQAVSSLTTDPRHLTTDFWERIEERIYAALRDYAEQAENGGGFQRRLFAEDAARGFAFIDVCRKRYDVALMNPPYGELSSNFDRYGRTQYLDTWKDVYACFIERLETLLTNGGLAGALTSLTFFHRKQLTRVRELLMTTLQLRCCAQLGFGVLDAAAVEVVAFTVARTRQATNQLSIYWDYSANVDLAPDGLVAARMASEAKPIDLEAFRCLERCRFAFWLPDALLSLWRYGYRFEPRFAEVVVGLTTFDNERFLRLAWETIPQLRYQRWFPIVKGGDYCPYFRDESIVADWAAEGAVMQAHEILRYNTTARTTQSRNYYMNPGLTFPRVGAFFGPRVLPVRHLMESKGTCIFFKDNDRNLWLGWLALLNTEVVERLLQAFGRNRFWETASVANLPFPPTVESQLGRFVPIGEKLVRSAQMTDMMSEQSGYFLVPRIRVGPARQPLSTDEITSLLEQAEELARSLFGLTGKEHLRSAPDDETGDESEGEVVEEPAEDGGEIDILHYAMGVAYGRWDIRYATGEQAAPELPDPFAPLPVCPPGQLQNAQGLPARPEDVPAAYPVRIPWDGILVDDPNHPLDIERRVREVIEIIWSGQEGGPTAEAIEHEACEILGVKSLRDYFRKPAGFFADHLKRYSKSRRKAPIYWPLSTPSGNYTLWLYYHRLNDGTLYKVVEQFVEPKQAEVQITYQTLAAKESRTKAEDTELEAAQTLMGELAAFRDDLFRLAKIWKPNLNDGVVITAAPLWKHFRLPAWQKELRSTWESLERGEYDWAHLAYSLWPDRVTEKCKTDRSLAIAHGLEHLCTIEPPKPKKKKTKVKVEEEEEML
jgi:hypothetical protein